MRAVLSAHRDELKIRPSISRFLFFFFLFSVAARNGARPSLRLVRRAGDLIILRAIRGECVRLSCRVCTRSAGQTKRAKRSETSRCGAARRAADKNSRAILLLRFFKSSRKRRSRAGWEGRGRYNFISLSWIRAAATFSHFSALATLREPAGNVKFVTIIFINSSDDLGST